MAKVSTAIARTDIYKQGLRTKDTTNKTGWSIDRSKPANDKDEVLVKKGEKYYYWTLFKSPKQISLTPPKRQQLTQSGYLQQVYDIEDAMAEISASDRDELESVLDDFKEQIESLKDEQQDKLDSMPEQLQSAPSGELLQERIDALDNAYSELDGIVLDDYEEPEESELREELQDGDDDAEITDEQIEELRQEKLQEWLDEKISEIQGISLE